ncbi:MAG: serine/threonine-protein kinase [Kiritimatiellae bacterium]|nr:serine/threonine-protein kinase [Kiritimatiellia bacterium]
MKDGIGLSLPNIELIGVIGRGGMSAVWRGRQISLDRHVAVKILSKDFAADPDDVRRFRQEAKAAASLKHPGIVQVYDANFTEGIYYFVMELVEGYTMGDLLRRKGCISVDDTLTVAESVAVAMDYAWSHFKMVHCDIKPDNIMVDADGTIKVTDLGLCRSMNLVKGEDRNDAADEILGTPAYMSPEQVYGSAALDCRSDIYSLGATLYHLVTGRLLFTDKSDDDVMRGHVGEKQAPDVRQFAEDAGGPFSLLLEKMLAKDAGHRNQDWRLLLADLARLRRGHPPWPVLIPPGGSSMLRDID